MPKIIPELRERFIASARRRLLEGDSHDITMRQVARDCHTATGTVYNYFPSKESLLAAAMMEDWLECCRSMRSDAFAQEEPFAALRATASALRRFTGRYAPIWRNYATSRNNISELNLRHHQVVEEIASAVQETLERFEVERDSCLSEVLGELILYASRSDDGFARISFALQKILGRDPS